MVSGPAKNIPDNPDIPAAARVSLWSLANMRRPDGAFLYQRHAHYSNRIPYMRWSIAPMFCALSRLLYAIDASVRQDVMPAVDG